MVVAVRPKMIDAPSSSHGIFTGPFACQFIVSLPVRFVYPGNLGDQWIVRVRIAQERTNGQQH